MSIFIQRLRESKSWDVAMIYAKGQPPISLKREDKFIVEDDGICIKSEPVVVQTGDNEYMKSVESIIHMDEIVRIDLFQKTEAPKLVVPQNKIVDPMGVPLSGKDLQIP